VAFGAPVNISLIDGTWGLSVFRAAPVQEAVAAALAKLEQGVVTALPYAGRLAGLAFGLLTPSSIAPDDKSMMPGIVTTLSADKVTSAPPASLPTQAATVEVHTRITDTREGMAIARAKGKLRGKKSKLSDKQQKELCRMHGSGEYAISDLAELFSVSRPTVYRTLSRENLKRIKFLP